MSFAEDDNYIMSLQKFGFQVATAELGSKILIVIHYWALPSMLCMLYILMLTFP